MLVSAVHTTPTKQTDGRTKQVFRLQVLATCELALCSFPQLLSVN